MTLESNTNLGGKWYDKEIGKGIFSKKYTHEDDNGITDVFKRVAKTTQLESMEDYMERGDIMPAGRAIYGAESKGKFNATLSNCYVLESPKDTIESIYDTNRDMARVFSYGGGCGLSIDNLRPKGAKVNNSAKTSSGAVSFLELFNATGDVIGQNGRRAALMVMLECSHPDIYEFLKIKQTNHKLESMNISIKFTDEFMRAVRDKQKYTLRFDVESTGEHIEKTIDAYEFFKEFCETNWHYGDPGACWIDTVRNHNLLAGYPEYKIDTSNPCSEYFGNSGNSCNLMSINLYNLVDQPFTKDAKINYEKLKELVKSAVSSLNNILDYGYSTQPLESNRKCIDDWRSIGLGVMGLADMYVALGLTYGSEEANELTEDVFHAILETALRASSQLAIADGPFKKYKWSKTKRSPFLEMLEGTEVYQEIQKYGLANSTLLSIAPTGSIATAIGVSTGIEPFFRISYERTTHSMENEGKTFVVHSKSVEDLLRFHGLPQDTPVEEIKKRFPFVVDTNDIAPLDRVRTQAVIQQYVDNAISSTVNLKESCTSQDIFEIYMAAWQSGLKGITVFRDGCARGNILGVTKEKPKGTIEYDSVTPDKRRGVHKINGSTYKKGSSCAQSMYVTVNKESGGKPFEIFTNSSGGCASNIGTITRLVSLALRSGVSVKAIIGELKENKCPACQLLRRQGNTDVSLSCGNAIADALEESYGETIDVVKGDLECPECHKLTLVSTGKCFSCPECGYSKCD